MREAGRKCEGPLVLGMNGVQLWQRHMVRALALMHHFHTHKKKKKKALTAVAEGAAF